MSETDESLAEFALRHRRLLTTPPSDERSEDRDRFIEALIDAGRSVAPGASRDQLRNMLYFWAGEQASLGKGERGAAAPKLAPFVAADRPSAPPSPAGSGATIALSVGPSTASPPSGAVAAIKAVVTRVSADSIDAVKDYLRPAGSSDPVVRPEPVTDADKEDRARAILRIAALARQWRLTKDKQAKRGYLLAGKALAEAARYEKDDPDILALVKASREKAAADQVWWRSVLIGLAVLVIAAAFGANRYARSSAEDAQELALSVQATTGTDELRAVIHRVVNAMAADNNVDPLKDFLKRYSDDKIQIDRLELAKAKIPAAEAISLKAATMKAPTNTRALQAANCNGYLWFGSARASRLDDKRDPSSLKAGDLVAIDKRDDLRLRSDWPTTDGKYTMSAQNGLVPAGWTVKVIGAPRPYRREDVQYWAPVTVPRAFCTSVFLQYVGPAAKRDEVLAALRNIGVQTLPAEQIGTASGISEVRYFWPNDRPIADQIADALGAFSSGGRLKVVDLTDYPKKPSSGTIEVWMDLAR